MWRLGHGAALGGAGGAGAGGSVRAGWRWRARELRRAGFGGMGSRWRRVGGEFGERDAAARDDGGAAMSAVD